MVLDGDGQVPGSSKRVDDTKVQVSGKHLLRRWVVDYNINATAVNALLEILHELVGGLPKDYRTLMKTPRFTNLREVQPGTYCHIGLGASLKSLLQRENSSLYEWCILFIHLYIWLQTAESMEL